ncbi:MAG TPA: Rrf2 family transcriptional regulator [Anaerolineaceae bacterium]|nr:Rrf2 family transcriptional regulator [Anaerolineaceae bacterium]
MYLSNRKIAEANHDYIGKEYGEFFIDCMIFVTMDIHFDAVCLHYSTLFEVSMFKISRRLDYGLQLMVTLAENENEKAIATATLAERLQIPLPFLHQIGHSLMQAGLLKATPGPKGGLRLNRPAEEISIYDITVALEGTILMNPCLDCATPCVRQEECTAKYMWADLQDKIILYLTGVKLGVLLNSPSENPLFNRIIKEETRAG